jgi:DNA-binding MarR family transcriptional regulator
MVQRAAKKSSTITTAPRKATRPAAGAKAARSAGRPFLLAPTVSLPALLDAQGGDRRFRQMLYDISTAATLLESARAYLASRLDVTPPQYNMLMVIAQFEGERGLSINEVAAHLHVSNTFVTAEVNKLVKRDLVVKVPNPEDARSVLLNLTAEGERQVQALEQDLMFVNDRLFAGLGASDFEQFSRIIAALIPDFERTVAVLDALAGARKAR